MKMNTDNTKCMFCEEEQPKYSCPRCLVQYCSLQCYQHQTHAECSEKFYKQQVLSELKDMKGTEEEKTKIINILKEMKTQDESEGKTDYNTDISERMNGINLEDTDAVWEKLTSHERDLFQKYVSKGNLGFMPIWTPWWLMEKRSKVIELPQKKKKNQRSKELPKLTKDLPQLKDIMSRDKPPDPHLKFCLMDILLTYTCTQRVFNGDMYDSPKETIGVVLQLTKVLTENKIYSDLPSSLHFFVHHITRNADINIDPITTCLHDLHLIVTSQDSYVLRVLSDFYTYLKKCCKYFRKEDEELAKRLFTMSKKVYFYLAYCGEFGREIKLLGKGVGLVRKQLLDDREKMKKEKELIEENLQRLKPKLERPLIEEI